MQNWKIKRMSVKRINQWLSAIGKLIKYYEGKVRIDGCPLCKVPQQAKKTTRCDRCLWEIFESTTCICFQKKNKIWGDMPQVRDSKRWQTLRIPMLKNWKKIFKLELARRDV